MAYKLRNYLAHYSEFARKKLQQQYKKTYSYSRFKCKDGTYVQRMHENLPKYTSPSITSISINF